MRTSDEIYHRIRWDPRFDAARFVLGVNVRGTEPKRIPLPSFVPGGDIPWHRVVFIEADGQVVWDRAAGVDLIDQSEAGRVRATSLLTAPFFEPRATYGWDAAAGWSPVSPRPATSGVTGLRVLTWNCLWDRYDSDRIDTARRRPLLLAALAKADADIIALQEVEAELLIMLRAAPWVRAGYLVSGDRSDVDRYGLLVLSRLPVREAAWHPLGPHKAVAAVTVEAGAGPVVVLSTHLSSDHSADGAARRERELAELARGLAGLDAAEVVVVGDLNDGGPGPAMVLKLRDTWTQQYGPDDQTPTFDPTTNPLAAVSSLSGRASRLDRVLVRGGLQPTAAALVGDRPVDGVFISDHAGVVVDLTVHSGLHPFGDDVLDVRTTARTALAWIPSAELWPAIEDIRTRHDPQAHRWPPHVNLVFGFVPESSFDAAAALVSKVAAGIAPFEARLGGVRSFAHRDGETETAATVWLDPAADGPAAWTAIHDAVRARLPAGAGRPGGYVPHLTLGRSRDPQRLTAQLTAQLTTQLASQVPDRATVGELVLLSRRGDEPMRPRATVALGSGAVRWVTGDASDPPTVDGAGAWRDALARLVEALPGSVVHVTGSRRMGCARPGADLDLVAAVPGEADLAAIEARLARVATLVQRVVGARVPGLRLRLPRAGGGIDADLAVVGTGAMDPSQAVQRRAELGEGASIALSAVSDAEAVLAAVEGREPAFAVLAAEVKAWARARGLDSAPFGGVPGLGWSVLAAVTVRTADVDATTAQLRQAFFATWAGWDWRSPVTVDGSPGPARAALSIFTPTAPVRLLTAQVGPGWRDMLLEELYRAWEIVEASDDGGPEPWAELLAPPPLHRRHRAWAVVRIPSGPPLIGDLVGRVRGRMRALLTALEEAGVNDAHAWPRPFVGGDGPSYAIGLGRTPPDPAELGQIARGWLHGLPDVELSWVDGGDVPTLT